MRNDTVHTTLAAEHYNTYFKLLGCSDPDEVQVLAARCLVYMDMGVGLANGLGKDDNGLLLHYTCTTPWPHEAGGAVAHVLRRYVDEGLFDLAGPLGSDAFSPDAAPHVSGGNLPLRYAIAAGDEAVVMALVAASAPHKTSELNPDEEEDLFDFIKAVHHGRPEVASRMNAAAHMGLAYREDGASFVVSEASEEAAHESILADLGTRHWTQLLATLKPNNHVAGELLQDDVEKCEEFMALRAPPTCGRGGPKFPIALGFVSAVWSDSRVDELTNLMGRYVFMGMMPLDEPMLQTRDAKIPTPYSPEGKLPLQYALLVNNTAAVTALVRLGAPHKTATVNADAPDDIVEYAKLMGGKNTELGDHKAAAVRQGQMLRAADYAPADVAVANSAKRGNRP
jgi:hypothetical protein